MSELFQSIYFSHPYFILGLMLPIVIMIASYLFNFYTSNRYCDKALLSWVLVKNKKNITRKFLVTKVAPVLAWILLCIAISGPRINIDERSLEPGRIFNNAAVFVLDVSASMLAEDVYPNRIAKAKLAIESMLLNSNNFLFSLVIFSHNAHVVIPLTYDNNVIREVLASIQPGMLPVAGSNYTSGLKLASQQLNLSDAKNKSIILFSDGDFDEKTPYADLKDLNDIPVNVFGVGTQEGQPIPSTNGGWLSVDNKPIFSQLNIVNLTTISNKHNGTYKTLNAQLQQENFNLLKFSGHTSSKISSNKTIIVWKQIYNWFLIPAIILFLLSTLKYTKESMVSKKIHSQSINPLIILLAFSFSIAMPPDVLADKKTIEAADAAYKNKNFIQSEALYKDLSGFNALLGQANSVYRQKNYSKAIHLYSKAILSANNNKNISIALFNLANTFYIIGDYPQSIALYRDTLQYNPSLKQARINMGYAITIDKRVKRELAIRNQARAIRPGAGPSTARIEQGVVIGDSKVTLADGEDNSEIDLYAQPLSDKIVTKLIERGIKHSNISTTIIDKPKENSQWNFEFTTLDMVELLVNQEKIENYKLWKRLFELEEGFPAPVQTPHIKPGIKSW